MKRGIFILLFFVIFAFAGCSDKRAQELYDTAQFEELQNNKPNAAKLYREILEKYPDTATAEKAKERLDAMK
ncbi:MAG: hypothetical protein JRK53_08015 [Deltaproteobacteria bacterium]|nr:hypothetical protein [Deltaproteobacteria bacterium]MBW1816588.1 hypothetical protein [Deltaproteobacteria bacterium]